MIRPSLLIEMAQPKADLKAVALRVIQQTPLLPQVFAGLQADKARTKFSCLKVLRLVSEIHPAVLYPDFDRMAELLDHENTIIKWGAIIIVGNLAGVDTDNKIDALLDRYLQPVAGPVMITAANTIGGAAKIGRAKPYLLDKIVPALLQVQKAKYQTAECRNVALGHVLDALDLVFEHIRDRQSVLDFAKRQLRNRRKAVQRRARVLLTKHGKLALPDPAAGSGS